MTNKSVKTKQKKKSADIDIQKNLKYVPVSRHEPLLFLRYVCIVLVRILFDFEITPDKDD